MILGYVKNLCQNIKSVDAMVDTLARAGAFDLITDCDFEFDSSEIFKNKRGSPGNSDKVEFLHFSKEMFSEDLHVRFFFRFIFLAFFFG
jgi:hypothetical protein